MYFENLSNYISNFKQQTLLFNQVHRDVLTILGDSQKIVGPPSINQTKVLWSFLSTLLDHNCNMGKQGTYLGIKRKTLFFT